MRLPFAPQLPSRLLRIAEEIHEQKGTTYLVGGWVRDALLGLECRDLDVEVHGLEQQELLAILGRYGKPNLVGKAFGVITLSMQGMRLDFSLPRLESKTGHGHRGFMVETHPSIGFAKAAERRDFTMNAMGVRLPDFEIVDPHGGAQDLEQGVLRHVGPAFAEDSLRVLRAVQFAARFGFAVHEQTVALCRTLDLSDLSHERIMEELKKWMLKPQKPSLGLSWFIDLALPRFFPQWALPSEGVASLAEALDAAAESSRTWLPLLEEDRSVVMFAVFAQGCQDQASVRKFMESITIEVALLDGVPKLWQQGRELIQTLHKQVPSDSWLRRAALRCPWKRLLVWLPSENKDELRERVERLGILDQAPTPLLQGRHLLAMGMPPGRAMGEWIKESFELQLDGLLATTEEAVSWAQARLISSEKS